jgi:hypothetical protein
MMPHLLKHCTVERMQVCVVRINGELIDGLTVSQPDLSSAQELEHHRRWSLGSFARCRPDRPERGEHQ